MNVCHKVVNGVRHTKEATPVRARKRRATEHYCQQCAAEIINIGSGRKPSYCSDSCKMQAYRARKKQAERMAQREQVDTPDSREVVA